MPYLGYWQLLNVVDNFVVYDKIQFTKKGWIHRNKFLQNGKSALFSLSLKKGSDFLNIDERCLSESNTNNIEKIIRQLENSYKKAPYFDEVMPLLIDCFRYQEKNLFFYIFHSITLVSKYLKIDTPIIISSSLEYNNNLKSQEKVLDICRALGADIYINSIGGRALYSKDVFDSMGLDLQFIQMDNIVYKQFGNEFIPNLSIIDVMMFNSVEEISLLLRRYKLIEN